jgi:hypothetical protein
MNFYVFYNLFLCIIVCFNFVIFWFQNVLKVSCHLLLYVILTVILCYLSKNGYCNRNMYVYGCGAVWSLIALQNIHKQTFEPILAQNILYLKKFPIALWSKKL